jgi:hypothetical protein
VLPNTTSAAVTAETPRTTQTGPPVGADADHSDRSGFVGGHAGTPYQ